MEVEDDEEEEEEEEEGDEGGGRGNRCRPKMEETGLKRGAGEEGELEGKTEWCSD